MGGGGEWLPPGSGRRPPYTPPGPGPLHPHLRPPHPRAGPDVAAAGLPRHGFPAGPPGRPRAPRAALVRQAARGVPGLSRPERVSWKPEPSRPEFPTAGRARRTAARPPPPLRPHQRSMRPGSPPAPLRLPPASPGSPPAPPGSPPAPLRPAQRQRLQGTAPAPPRTGSWAPVGVAPRLPRGEGGTGNGSLDPLAGLQMRATVTPPPPQGRGEQGPGPNLHTPGRQRFNCHAEDPRSPAGPTDPRLDQPATPH